MVNSPSNHTFLLSSAVWRMDALFRDWAGLPACVLDLMVMKLGRVFDYIRFSGVCLQWRCVALKADVIHKVNLNVLRASHKTLPLLIFKTDEDNNEWRSVYSLSNRLTYKVKLPCPYKYRFSGSSLGWLFCVDETLVVTLVNPFNNGCISLPEFVDPRLLHKLYFDYEIRKGILLSDPLANPHNFGVVVVFDNYKVASFMSGESSWNIFDSEFQFDDIINYKSKLYGVDVLGELVQIDFASKTIKTISPATDGHGNRAYLVESQDGELLMVQRRWMPLHLFDNHAEANALEVEIFNNEGYGYDDDDDQEPVRDKTYFDRITVDDFPKSGIFKVFKMMFPIEEGSPTWVEINTIGEHTLFVGDNQSVSVSTTEYAECSQNSIYYTSEHHNRYCEYKDWGPDDDSGIFNLEHGISFPHHVSESFSRNQTPPIWFLPNP